MSTVTKAMVIAILAEQRVNRPRSLADQNIRSILQRYGNGATNIGELAVGLYEAVYRAAGGVIPEREPWDVDDAPCVNSDGANCYLMNEAGDTTASHARIRSPMAIDLENRLAEARAKTKRSTPTMHVDYGNASRSEDQRDDVVRDFPAGERVR